MHKSGGTPPPEPNMTSKNEHIQRHLRENASDCRKNNVRVRVERINRERQVAFCTVQQHRMGFLHRDRSTAELVWRAEQALSPLLELGISPLITVRQPGASSEPTSSSRTRRSTHHLLPAFVRWLGWPLLRERIMPQPLARDPFGWRQALRTDRNR